MSWPTLATFRLEADTRLVGSLALVAALVVYAMALEALRQEQHTQDAAPDTRRLWWFGYARDLTNLLGLALIAFAHYLIGFSARLALLGGFFTGFTLYILDYAVAHGLRLRRSTSVVVAVMLLATLPTQIVPFRVAQALRTMLGHLFR